MVEFEQWVTWSHGTRDANNYNLYEFKEELEIGIDPTMQLGFEIPNWHFQTGPEDEKQGPRFDKVAADLRYIILDPTKNFLGLAVKPEISLGPDVFELEGRLILQKNVQQLE